MKKIGNEKKRRKKYWGKVSSFYWQGLMNNAEKMKSKM